MQNAAVADSPHLQNAATPPGGFADAAHANAAPCQGGGPAQKAVDFSRDSLLNATAGLILVGTTDRRVLRPQRQAIRPDRPVVRTSNISARRDLKPFYGATSRGVAIPTTPGSAVRQPLSKNNERSECATRCAFVPLRSYGAHRGARSWTRGRARKGIGPGLGDQSDDPP